MKLIILLLIINVAVPKQNEAKLLDNVLGPIMQLEVIKKYFGTILLSLLNENQKQAVRKLFFVEGSKADFFLITSSNSTPTKIEPRMESISSAGFIKNAELKIISHGFLSSYKDGPGSVLPSAYLTQWTKFDMPINIILVDWSALAGTSFKQMSNVSFLETIPPLIVQKFYFQSAKNTVVVGNNTKELIDVLITHNFTTCPKIHLIGHSLGAHAMAFAAEFVLTMFNKTVRRLTALDPANLCFEVHLKDCPEHAIKKSVAGFLDVFHTSIFGFENATGHADFYPNYGKTQNSCSFYEKFTCSHSKATEFMAQSIGENRTKLMGQLCSSSEIQYRNCSSVPSVLLGEFCPMETRGIFYVKTT